MGFLGQELPGSIICAECTCSHMPMYNRRHTYLRLHVFMHPPLGTCSPWVHAHQSLPPALYSVGWMVLHVQDAACRCQPSPMSGRTSPWSILDRSPCSCLLSLPEPSLSSSVLSTPPACLLNWVPGTQHWLSVHVAHPSGSPGTELRGV